MALFASLPQAARAYLSILQPMEVSRGEPEKRRAADLRLPRVSQKSLEGRLVAVSLPISFWHARAGRPADR